MKKQKKFVDVKDQEPGIWFSESGTNLFVPFFVSRIKGSRFYGMYNDGNGVHYLKARFTTCCNCAD